jgi:cysteine desulfurase
LEREALARVPTTHIIGAARQRLPNTSCLALPGVPAETLVMALDLAGVAVSAGSACSSGKVKASHVLQAMSLPPEIAGSAIRVSLGWASAETDIDRFLDAWQALAVRLGLAAPGLTAA